MNTEFGGFSPVSRVVAEADVNKWLDYKKVRQRIRDRQEDGIETLIDEVVDGGLVLNDDMSFTQTLSFPVTDEKGGVVLSELTYKPRIRVQDVSINSKSLDANSFILNYGNALTDTPSGILSKMDLYDYKILQAIVGFFI